MRLCAYAYLYTGESIAVCVQNYALYPVMTAVTAFSAYPCSADIKRNIIVCLSYVSLAQIGRLILSVDGITDYRNLKLGGKAENIRLTNEQIPVVGKVVLNLVSE